VLLRVDQLRTGEVGREESEQIREHFRTCETCDDTYEEVERFARELRSAAGTPARSTVDNFDTVATPGGDVWVAFSERGLKMIGRSGTEDEFRDQYAEVFRRCLTRSPLPADMRAHVLDAIEGRSAGGAAVDLNGLPAFEQEVLAACSAIPHGEVRTYSWIARVIGRPKATRAVGNALHRNPVAPVIPCHRVVPSSGGIGNYALGRARKIDLLSREGVEIAMLEELARTHARYFGFDGAYCEPTCSRIRNVPRDQRLPLRNEAEARTRGFEPCRRCAPLALTA
jgi:methylated-DNA-[protein]-cysteine S-methyltransferase